jgi:hypothetical protein
MRFLMATTMMVFVLLPLTAVQASPLTIYGFWPRDISMGGAATASEPSPGAAFLNPGGAGHSKEQIVGISFSAFSPHLFINRSLPICNSDQIACSELYPGGFSERESLFPDHALGLSLGWIKPLGGFFKRRFTLSTSIYLPTKNILKAEGVDSSIPHFVMYQSLTDKIVLASAVSWRPMDWVSVGLGIQALADLGSDISLDIDMLGHRFVKQDLNVSIEPKVGLVTGILIRPRKNVSIGATFRQALPLVFRIPADFSLGQILEADIYFEGIVLYSPDQLEVGAAYLIESLNLELTFQANLSYWSSMRDLSPRIDVNFGGDVIDGLGAGELLDLRETESRPLLGFRDNWTFHGGFEWQTNKRIQIRGGGQYRPSPAANMTGNQNLLDNDAWGLSAGVGIIIGDMWGIQRAPVHLDIAFTSLFLAKRSAEKEGGDPIGDLNHGGFVLGGGLSLSHRY